MLGNAPKAMLEHRLGVLTPQEHPLNSPFGNLVFAPRCVEPRL
jgi:hypothetical protein